MVFALDRAGVVGEDGPTHHGAYDLSYLRAMPGMVVSVPRDEPTLRALLRVGLAHEGPFALRYPRGQVPAEPLPLDPQTVRIGRGELVRDGADAAVCVLGPLVYQALEAAEMLAGEGLDVAVFDARFAKPVDGEMITALARRTGRLLTVEDGVAGGGFGSAVLESLARSGDLQRIAVRTMGLPDQPVPHGPARELLRSCGLSAEGIAAAVRGMLR
ncbi:MAG: hypothetical protein A2Y96_01020 [Firmicutes bacterium RBG_13_65_8]|nr:MAG: hypothetical protein A2Y96_01020 [Firmicutes bacterium RBG_13_65_8]